MPIRAILLRLMLAALFLACAAAIISIFVSIDNDLAARFIGSSVLIAVGCALVLPVMPREDAHRISLSGTVWIIVVAVEVLTALLSMWADLLRGRLVSGESFALAMFILFFGFFAAVIPIRQLERTPGPLHRISLLATGLLGVVTTGIVATLLFTGFSSLSPTLTEKLLGSWFALIGGSIVLSCCACGLIRSAPLWRRILAILGIAVTALAVICWMRLILTNFGSNMIEDVALLPWAFMASGIAVGIALLLIGKALPLGRIESRIIPWITLITIAVGWLAADVSAQKIKDALTWRLLAATCILDACMGLTTIILYRTGRRNAAKQWSISGADLTCPRCGKKSTFSVGEHPCTHCGFQVLIAFRDIQCARCRHDVRHLPTGSPCPECGLAIENSAANYLLAGATGTDAASA